MSGHTPGPWEVCGHDIRGPYSMGDSERPGLHICTVAGGDRDNARLIAASPELLAAARETVSAMTDRFSLMGADDDYIYDELGSELAAAFFSARAAIAKATGEAA